MKLKPTKLVYEALPHEDFLTAKVTKIEVQSADKSKFGKEQLKFELTCTAPEEVEDKKIVMWFNPIISSSDSKKASKLRSFIESADPGTLEEVEANDEEYDIDDLLGKKVRVMMEEPVEDKFQKVATVRTAKKSAAEKRAEADEEEEEAPKPKAKAKPVREEAEEEEEETPKPKAKKKPVVEEAEEEEEENPKPKAKKKPVVEEEEEEDRPAPKKARKKLNYKK